MIISANETNSNWTTLNLSHNLNLPLNNNLSLKTIQPIRTIKSRYQLVASEKEQQNLYTQILILTI